MNKPINREGIRYGLLTAITPSLEYGYKKWVCKCDCGNYLEVQTNNLKSGNTESCGCLKNLPHRRIDLTGRVFGRLTVLGYSDTVQGAARWICKCSCGSTSIVKATKLLRGSTESCGCLRNDIRKHRRKTGKAKWARTIKEIFACCVKCNSTDDLHSHHIYPVSTNAERKADFNNGVVLCKSCHTAFHKRYGKYTHGADELKDFLGLSDDLGSILKLVANHRNKNGKEDLEKAIHELQLLIELEYPTSTEQTEPADQS